jgi:CRP/FNR family transcriptional regulator
MLPQTDVLALMPAPDRADLARLAQVQSFRKGDLLFHAGAPSKHVYFLRNGRVKIYRPSPSGKEVILWLCLPGDMFGFADATLGGGRAVNAQACEQAEALCLSQSQLNSYLGTHPTTALLIMQVLASRLRALGDVMATIVNDDVQTRIMKLILRLAARYGAGAGQDLHLDIHLTHQEIADMVGTTRQSVTTVLSQLTRQGVMRLENRQIHIENLELLDTLANPS